VGGSLEDAEVKNLYEKAAAVATGTKLAKFKSQAFGH
jgi:hypothetical protein